MAQSEPVIGSEEPVRVAANAWLSPNERNRMLALAKENQRSLAAEMRMAIKAWLELREQAA